MSNQTSEFHAGLQQNWMAPELLESQSTPQIILDIQQEKYCANTAFDQLLPDVQTLISELAEFVGSKTIFLEKECYSFQSVDYLLEIYCLAENNYWISVLKGAPKDSSLLPASLYEFVLDTQNQSQKLAYLSQGCEDLLGYSAGQIMGQQDQLFARVLAEDLEGFFQSIEHSAKTLEAWEYIFRYQHPYKGLRYLLARSLPVCKADKIIWSGVILDVTEHERAHLKTQERESHLSAVLQAIPDLIFRINLEGQIVLPDSECLLSLSEHLKHVLRVPISEAFIDDLKLKIADTIRSDEPQSIEFSPDSSETHYEVRVLKSGKAEALCILRNISEFKQIQEQLSQHRQNLQAMIEHSPDNIWFVNSKMELLVANKPCHNNSETFYGHKIETGENVIDFMALKHPERAILWKDYYAQALQGEQVVVETTERFHGQTYYVENTFSPVLEQGVVRGCLVISRNITPHKDIQAKLQAMNDDLEVRVKDRTQAFLEAKELAEEASHANASFLANMSHEIRTPLNAVLGYTNLLEEHIQEVSQRKYIHGIKSSARNLLKLINDLLDLSKLQSDKMELQPEPMDLIPLLEEMQHIFEMQLKEKDISFRLVYPNLPGRLFLDEVRIRQVLFNLLGNAVKFTEQGEVSLSLSYYAIADNQILLTFKVSDTGIGIQQASLDSIFEAFTQQEGQRTKKYGGTGLGLSITKRLVLMMGGEIELETKPGQGSCFSVHIPVQTVPFSFASEMCHPLPETCPVLDCIVIGSRAFIVEHHKRFGAEQRLIQTLDSIDLDLSSFHTDLILLELPLKGKPFEETLKRLRANFQETRLVVFCQDKPLSHLMTAYAIEAWLPPNTDSASLCDFCEYNPGLTSLASSTPVGDPSAVDPILWTQLSRDWQLAVESHSFDVISDFSEALRFCAMQDNNLVLLNYAEYLTTAVASFDVQEMDFLLAQFPRYVQSEEPPT